MARDSNPVSTNCGEEAYSIARFAEGEPVDRDEHARSTCEVLDLRQQPVRRCEWQWNDRRRPTSMVFW